MARLYLLDHEYFDPLAQRRICFPASPYSHVIALISAAKAY